ncbi:MAG: 50S ribosomal protein L17 [Bacteroidales bacterium]|nr:50S ribosomal protein L17 [Bacteroidales bacterium]
MRHRDKINHLGRTYGHRKSMLTNMAISLIMSVTKEKDKRIHTTVAKAKELRTFIEPILTASKANITYAENKAKNDEEKFALKNKRMAAHRLVFAKLANKEAVKTLFEVVTPAIYDRPGGYTRILKTGFRLGDNAQTCIMELVDFNKDYKQGKNASAKPAGKTTRRSRKKKAADAPAAEAAATEAKAE